MVPGCFAVLFSTKSPSPKDIYKQKANGDSNVIDCNVSIMSAIVCVLLEQ